MTVKLTANFERNLADIEAFLIEAEAPQAFDALLDEVARTTIPNLERFPGMGRLFLERPVRSVEVANGIARLTQQLGAPADVVLFDPQALWELDLTRMYSAGKNTPFMGCNFNGAVQRTLLAGQTVFHRIAS